MQYFGYVLPSLTALLIARRGFNFADVALRSSASGVMLAFLSQGGGRRIIGVTVGAAIIVWIQAQPDIKVRTPGRSRGAAVVGLLTAMQFMLNIRTVRATRSSPSAARASTTTCTSTTISCAWRR